MGKVVYVRGAELSATSSHPVKEAALHRQSLKANLEGPLALPAPAVDWLMGLWDCAQVFDDVADGDPVSRPDLNRVIRQVLVEMPGNPFFMAKCHALLPVVSLAILKWQASDDAERAGAADARSFVWRAAFYDVVLMVVSLCHEDARPFARDVMTLYGEDFAEYLREFAHA